MKNQALLSSKAKSKKFKCRLLQYLFGALRINKAKDSAEFFYPSHAAPVHTL